MLTTMKLVYKNMTWNRPKIGLYGLTFVAGFCTVNLFMNLLKFGLPTAIVFGIFSLSLWFFGLPMVMTLIDLKMNPKRMEKVWELVTKR